MSKTIRNYVLFLNSVTYLVTDISGFDRCGHSVRGKIKGKISVNYKPSSQSIEGTALAFAGKNNGMKKESTK